MSNLVSFYRINSIRSCVTGAVPARGAAYLHEIKFVALHFRFVTSDFSTQYSVDTTIRLCISFTLKID